MDSVGYIDIYTYSFISKKGRYIMACYDYCCNQCKHKFDLILTYEEYDSTVIECPKCNSSEVYRRYDNMPNLAFGNSVGAQAEKNTKKIGKAKISEYNQEQKETRAKKRKLPWYGKMDPQKSKELGKITDKKLQKIAINKYIMESK